MKDCERYEQMISALLDGELSREEEAELRRHIASCPDCAAMYEAFAAVGTAIRGQEVPDTLHEGIMSKVRAAEKASRTQSKIVRLRPILAAAACLVVLVGTVLALKNTVGMGSAAPQAPKAKDAPFAGTYSSGAEAASTNGAPAEGAPEIWLPESKAAEAESAGTPAEAPKSMEPLPDQITADTAVTGEAPVNAQVNAKAEERSFTLRLTALTDDGFEGAVTDGSDSGASSNLPLVTVLWEGDGAALEPGMLVIVTVSTAEQEESGVFRAIRVEPAEEP